MTVDESLKALLLSCCNEVARLKYNGKADEFITYQIVTVLDSNYADDNNETIDHSYRIDIYSKGNYMTLLTNVKAALKAAGWHSIEIDLETYEQDTGYFHVPVDAKFLEVK